jgi:hypothetical protein
MFKTVFKILNRNFCKNSSHGWLNVLNVWENAFLSAHSKSSGNSHKSAGAKSGEYSGWSMAEMPFRAKNCDIWSEECATKLWRINGRSLHNYPCLRFTTSISIFNTSMQNVSLTVLLLGTYMKWMIHMMLKKQIFDFLTSDASSAWRNTSVSTQETGIWPQDCTNITMFHYQWWHDPKKISSWSYSAKSMH